MATVFLSPDFVAESQARALVSGFSLAEEIEFSARVGQILIDNPELTFSFASESLLAFEEMKKGMVKRYERRS